MKGNLIPVLAIAIGGILLYSAITNVHPVDLIKATLQGQLNKGPLRSLGTVTRNREAGKTGGKGTASKTPIGKATKTYL